MTPFAEIRARAEGRKGGAAALARLLPPRPDRTALARIPDDRVLAAMARRVFSAGFAWRVIDARWPGFEAAFLRFDPALLALQPDGFWDGLLKDAGIVRNAPRIAAVRANAAFVRAVAREHGSFAAMLAAWPEDDQVGLLALLATRGSRLGGASGQLLLRFLGFDGFITSPDVVTALRDAGLDIAVPPNSKRDLARVQAQFNAWHGETGLSYAQLSRILAMSTGRNLDAPALMPYLGTPEAR